MTPEDFHEQMTRAPGDRATLITRLNGRLFDEREHLIREARDAIIALGNEVARMYEYRERAEKAEVEVARLQAQVAELEAMALNVRDAIDADNA
jgi:hypothetical protein